MEEDFGIQAGRKFVENILSVKVWIILLALIISSCFLDSGKMSGTVWASFNGGIITTVCGLREIFKVAKVRSSDDSSRLAP